MVFPVPKRRVFTCEDVKRDNGFLGSILVFAATVKTTRANQVSLKNCLAKGRMPPSVMLKFRFRTRLGSIFKILPKPLQAGQAPWGELNEKRRGSISGKEIRQTGQAKFCE